DRHRQKRYLDAAALIAIVAEILPRRDRREGLVRLIPGAEKGRILTKDDLLGQADAQLVAQRLVERRQFHLGAPVTVLEGGLNEFHGLLPVVSHDVAGGTDTVDFLANVLLGQANAQAVRLVQPHHRVEKILTAQARVELDGGKVRRELWAKLVHEE